MNSIWERISNLYPSEEIQIKGWMFFVAIIDFIVIGLIILGLRQRGIPLLSLSSILAISVFLIDSIIRLASGILIHLQPNEKKGYLLALGIMCTESFFGILYGEKLSSFPYAIPLVNFYFILACLWKLFMKK